MGSLLRVTAKNSESDPRRRIALSCQATPKRLILSHERGGGAKLFAAGVGIQDLIIALPDLSRSASRPVERRIKNVTAAIGIPSQPSMRLPTSRRSLANDEADVRRPVFAHLLVESDGFGFAVGGRAGLSFRRGFPEGGKAVRDRTKISHPLINNGDRHLGSGGVRRRGENGADPRHLPIVRR